MQNAEESENDFNTPTHSTAAKKRKGKLGKHAVVFGKAAPLSDEKSGKISEQFRLLNSKFSDNKVTQIF